MGRFLRKLRERRERRRIGNQEEAQRAFEEEKPDAMRKDVRMISGCEDKQTSADVSNVHSFQLPDPAGRAGGACTSTLLRILYKDETIPEDTLSFTQVLEKMREDLAEQGYTQIPQLTANNPIDVEADFDLVPSTATGTRRAVMIGINYIGDDPGELRGCHNDVLNMKKYIMEVHGFEEDNIVVLMDDGEHDPPTRDNILAAYEKVVADSEAGDAIFLHYSGKFVFIRLSVMNVDGVWFIHPHKSADHAGLFYGLLLLQAMAPNLGMTMAMRTMDTMKPWCLGTTMKPV